MRPTGQKERTDNHKLSTDLYMYTVDVCLHIYIHSYIHTFIHTYSHTFIYTYIHPYIYSYIHTYIYIYVCMYICAVNRMQKYDGKIPDPDLYRSEL